MQPTSDDQPAASVLADVEYAPASDWEKHTLDVYIPSIRPHGANAASLIVFVHGGAWRTGDKSGFVQLARSLADSTGDVVAVINYSLSIATVRDDPTSVPLRAQHPKHVQDVAAALGYLYTRADSLGGYNRDQIYLVGHSAGGQIAGLLALRPDLFLEPKEKEFSLSAGTLHTAIRGIVGVEGIYDVDRLLTVWPAYRDFIVQAFGQEQERRIQGSPQGQTTPGSPFRLPYYAVIHSNQDELVDTAQATDYHAYLLTIADDKSKVALEFGDWGGHDEMLQTTTFTKTITRYIQQWRGL